MTGPLSTRVATLCDEIASRVGPDVAGQARHIGERLSEPLRVAIAGRLKAGKSTLVNALIGRRVAPTAVGECTRVVTRFRYGPADRVDVVCRDDLSRLRSGHGPASMAVVRHMALNLLRQVKPATSGTAAHAWVKAESSGWRRPAATQSMCSMLWCTAWNRQRNGTWWVSRCPQ